MPVSEKMRLTGHEAAYVEARAAGCGPSDAYRAAYSAERMSPKAISVEASRLEKRPRIALALSLVQETAVERVIERLEPAIASAEWIVTQAVEIVREARAAEQFGPANSALALLAKRHPEFRDGPLIDQSQHLHLPAGLSIEELKRLARGDAV